MRYVIRCLTESDLTFFSSHYTGKGAKQKAINLDSGPFISLFPSLKGVKKKKIDVSIVIQGPDHARTALFIEDQKVAKSAKNWRLNGKIIQDNDGRFKSLVKGDLAIIGFKGEEEPEHVRLILISGSDKSIKHAFEYLDERTSRSSGSLGSSKARTMHVMDEQELAVVAGMSNFILPIFSAPGQEEEDIIEAASGSPLAKGRILARRGRRPVTHEELMRAKQNAEAVGRKGEAHVNLYLASLKTAGLIKDYLWEANVDATHPWDFSVVQNDGIVKRIEVKTTQGAHGTTFYVSRFEFEEIHGSPATTEIWRLSSLTDHAAMLRISMDVDGLSKAVHDGHTTFMGMVAGVRSTGWAVQPDSLQWGAEIWIP